MTIKAILRDGVIQPLEPLPSEWANGQELLVEQPDAVPNQLQLNVWQRELDKATADVPDEEHDRFQLALADIERESKDAVRREWGIP